ncbi:hypothetical protein [Geoglobus sp.]
MRYRLASLASALLATYVAVQAFSTTGVYSIASLFLSPQFIYVLFVVPLVAFALGKRIFGKVYLSLLLILTVSPMLQDSEVFEGIVDSLYYLGFEGFSKAIVNMFPLRDSMLQVFAVTSLYLISLYLDRLEEYESELRRKGYKYSAYPTVITLALLLIAFYTLLPHMLEIRVYGDFVYGAAAASILVAAIGAIWWLK